MAVLLGRLPLLAADYSGALSVLGGMGGYVLLCGPAGCLENYTGMEDPEWFTAPGPVFTSDMREKDVVFGIERSLKQRVRAYVERFRPPFIALVGTPVTSLIGSDLAGIAAELEAELGVPAIAAETTGDENYTTGIDAAYRALAARFVAGMAAGGEGVGKHSGVNILGYTKLDYCDGSDLEALIAHEEQGETAVRCVVGSCGCEQLAELANAERNLVVSASGLGLARFLRSRFGTPYTCDLPIGGSDASGVPAIRDDVGAKRALILGDQVVSNALRAFVEVQYGISCDVATCGPLHEELSRDGDARIKSEGQLVMLAGRGYDYIIADPLCRAIAPEDVEFVDIPHLALSSLPFAAQHVHLFTGEIVETLGAAFSV